MVRNHSSRRVSSPTSPTDAHIRLALFAVILACLAVAVAAGAQEQKAAKIPRIGMLWAFSVQRPEIHTLIEAFRHGLREFG